MSENPEILSNMHNQLEELNCKLKTLKEEKQRIKKENAVAAAAIKGMNNSLAGKKGAKQSIRPLEEKPEEIAIRTKAKLRELIQEEKELLIKIDALEQAIMEAQNKLEFIENEECSI